MLACVLTIVAMQLAGQPHEFSYELGDEGQAQQLRLQALRVRGPL